MIRRFVIAAFVCGLSLATLIGAAPAQDFPSRAIRVLIGPSPAERVIEMKHYALPKLALALELPPAVVEKGKPLIGTLLAKWMYGKPVENAAGTIFPRRIKATVKGGRR